MVCEMFNDFSCPYFSILISSLQLVPASLFTSETKVFGSLTAYLNVCPQLFPLPILIPPLSSRVTVENSSWHVDSISL